MNEKYYDTETYYVVVRKILYIAAEVIISSNIPYDKDNYEGRAGSASCEEMIKACIRENVENIIARVNNELPQGWKLISFDAPENNDDASSRKMSDITFVLSRPDGSQTVEQVNIKATSGSTADNVGGWAAFYYAIFGIIKKNVSKKFVLEEIAKHSEAKTIPDVPHDYILWSFKKDSTDFSQLCSTAEVHSFFGTSLEAFVVNINQSFPLQFKLEKATIKPYTYEGKIEFISFVLEKALEKIEKEFEAYRRASNALHENQKIS